MRNGIDVSYCQTRVDWKKVKSSGIEFAMIRVGYCYNDGSLKVDKMFQQHMRGAAAAGIHVGVYLYSYAKTPQAAHRAAQDVIKAVAPFELTYPIAFDIEYETIYTNGSKENNTAISKAFLDEIEKAGYYAMLYCSKDFLDSHLIASQLSTYDKWIAQYASRCTCKHPYGIWQYTGAGRVNGIVGNVDRNYSYKDYPNLISNIPKKSSQQSSLPYTVTVNTSGKELSDRGYFVFMSHGKVCVGKFATQEEAQKTADDLKRKGFSGSVTTW